MKKEEKHLLDELFEAAGLDKSQNEQPVPSKEKKNKENERKKEKIEENDIKEDKKEETAEDSSDIQETTGNSEKKDHVAKKKDIRFLVIYTVIFVLVISSLITGSYVITSRIHQQMSESNENLNTSQSTLKNIQDQNNALKQENAALKLENEFFSTSAEDAQELLNSIGDMVEHDGYLIAAQNAFINEEKDEADLLMRAIDREKLSQPAKKYYDLLKKELES